MRMTSRLEAAALATNHPASNAAPAGGGETAMASPRLSTGAGPKQASRPCCRPHGGPCWARVCATHKTGKASLFEISAAACLVVANGHAGGGERGGVPCLASAVSACTLEDGRRYTGGSPASQVCRGSGNVSKAFRRTGLRPPGISARLPRSAVGATRWACERMWGEWPTARHECMV